MDIHLYHIDKGKGKPLILLHGNDEDHTYFKHQIKFFSEKCRVVAIDTRGHGMTERGNAPFTLKQFAEDLRDFMDEKGIDKADILGFSDGANIALEFVLKYPDKVNRLILNGGNLYPHGVKNRIQLPIIIAYTISKLFKKRNIKALRNNEMLGLMVNYPNIKPESLKQITHETLVIAGDRDMIKDKHTKLIFNSLPNAELKIIKGNHFIASSNYQEFNTAVAEFLHY
ncbi:MAG TPA: alpha/beta hydrolase [Bacteroidetes bacterium]|nr:alpha/beta hydrolase [Candidatus Limimorpha avicola]